MSNATSKSAEKSADRWTDERVDNLAALITVTDEQLADRKRAEQGLETDSARVRQLVTLVFGADTPSVREYLAAHNHLVAA